MEHGIRIIREMGEIARRHNIRAGVKLQFRDLDTFIHPAHRESRDNKHIRRFLSTRLSENDFRTLVEEIKKQGMVSIVTPFDEPSVDMIERLHVEVVKIGSCSAHDWPLLEKVSETGKPVICSTGGLKIEDIDRIVSFFHHRGVHLALMHCVAIYPTPSEKLHLNQIRRMRHRYPGITIGFSTHEEPSDTSAIQVAYAKGARIYEKHVGVPTETITLNAYSATPEQVDRWVRAQKNAAALCGHDEEREISEQEKSDLASLMRGVYVKKDIRAGTQLQRSDVFFAMPIRAGQLASGQWRDGLVANRDYKVHEAVDVALAPGGRRKKDIIYSTIHAVKGMLNEARIPVGHEFSVELSHHYGIDRFHEVGCTLIECINREYAKKILIQLPGQWNPVHYHKKKDETFHMFRGVLEIEIEGQKKVLHPGDTLWIPRGVWHGFGTETGAIFEEVSTTASGGDSFYVDRTIARIPRDERKTYLRNWGRHQFDDES